MPKQEGDIAPPVLLPTDLTVVARDPDKIAALPFIADAVRYKGSFDYYPEGLFQWAWTFPDEYLEIIKSTFQPPSAALIAGTLAAYIGWRTYKLQKASFRRQNEIPEDDQKSIRKIIEKIPETKGAISRLQELMFEHGEVTPIGLVSAALASHLNGRPEQANEKFELFFKSFPIFDPITEALVSVRYAKSLSAAGEFDKAVNRYNAALDKNLPSRLAATVARECSNVLGQIAWEHPRRAKGWKDLADMTARLGGSILEAERLPSTGTGTLNPEFLKAAHNEFEILSDRHGKLDAVDLENLKRAIRRQARFSKRTGRNRYTQLAAAYLRFGEPDKALRAASLYENDAWRGPLELAANHIVQAQALANIGQTPEAVAKIDMASTKLSAASTLRLRRAVRFLRAKYDPNEPWLSRVTAYLWPRGYARTFVIAMPSLTL